MATNITQGLRARLRGRRAALALMGDLYELEENEAADCWWMHKSVTILRRGDAEPRAVRLRDGAEALALLTVLARNDYAACVSEVRTMSRFRRLNRPILKTQVGGIGFSYTFFDASDLVPIFERIVSTDPPTPQYLDDFVWLKNAMASHGGELRVAPIPVRLIACLIDTTPEALAATFRQIVDAVVAQQLHRQVPWDNDYTQAASASRFKIAEVDFDLSQSTVNVKALKYLTRLTQLGVRVRCLPTIQADHPSPQDSLSVIKCLHTLLPPVARDEPFVGYVHVGEKTSLQLVPSIFTAIQSNRSVEAVEVSVQHDLAEEQDEIERATASSVWKWAAYTLFSRRAASHVKTVRLHVYHLDQLVISAVEDVIRADNPLSAILDTMDEGYQWVMASCFCLVHPDDAQVRSVQSWYVSADPLIVQALATFESSGEQWRRVVLPGYGPAFVRTTESADMTADVVQFQECSDVSGLDLQLEGLDSENMEDVASFLQMVPRKVNSIVVASSDDVGEAFDMTDWTIAVLNHFTSLKELTLPTFARLSSLQIFVEAAEAGKSRLQSLNLAEPIESNSSDLVTFLNVLGDSSHPLTRNLEEFDFSVSAPDTVSNEFTAAWLGMLERNRTLLTVRVIVTASKPMAAVREKVAIRTGPMAITSKLAFLSVLQGSSSNLRARTRLDNSVTATIFEFAAQHQLRRVFVEHFWE